jgi:hypothetical protein
MYKLLFAGILTTTFLLAAAAPVVTMSPSTGEGLEADLTIGVAAPDGVSSITEIRVMIKQDMNADNACVLVHYPGTPTVLLRSDTGLLTGSPVSLGTPGSDANSQCAVYGRTSSVTVTPDTYTLKLHVHFAKQFAGLRRIWVQLVDRNDAEASRWMLMGEWVVPEHPKFPGRVDRFKVRETTESVELSTLPATDVEPRVYHNGLLLAPAEDYIVEDRRVVFIQPVLESDVIQVVFQPSCSAP